MIYAPYKWCLVWIMYEVMLLHFTMYQNFCVSFDRYMDIEKSVVDVFCSTVNMDLCTQILDFCECRSTKFLCKF